MITQVLFGLSLLCAVLILGLALATMAVKNFQFWPPPPRMNGKKSWQGRMFLWLFRGMVYPLVVLTVFEYKVDASVSALIRLGLGVALMAVGFGLAFRITFEMGWKNAFGEARGLKTDGWFARSRNPVYVVTWIGLLGWELIANSPYVTVILIVWALFYVFAPLLEEPWLEQQYGDAYRTYKANVRRYF